jgi:DNA recombination protein RmuC
MRAVAFGWRQEQIGENAKQISDLGRHLYEHLRTLAEHFEDAGTSLGRAVSAYNKTVNSLETRVPTAARCFQELGAAAGEEISLLEPVDQVPGALVASSDQSGSEATG